MSIDAGGFGESAASLTFHDPDQGSIHQIISPILNIRNFLTNDFFFNFNAEEKSIPDKNSKSYVRKQERKLY